MLTVVPSVVIPVVASVVAWDVSCDFNVDISDFNVVALEVACIVGTRILDFVVISEVAPSVDSNVDMFTGVKSDVPDAVFADEAGIVECKAVIDNVHSDGQ